MNETIISILDAATDLISKVDKGAHAALAALAALRAEYAPADPTKVQGAKVSAHVQAAVAEAKAAIDAA